MSPELTTETQATLARIDVRSKEVIAEVDAFAVTSVETHATAITYLKNLNGYDKAIEAAIREEKQEKKAAHSAVCAVENDLRKPLKVCGDALKSRAGAFLANLRKEEARKAAEEAKAAKEEQERKDAIDLAQAEIIESEEGSQAADAFLELAKEEVVATIAKPAYVPPAGTQLRTKYSVKIVDAELVPLIFRPVDEKLLAAHARTYKDQFDVPGCELVKTYNTIAG